MFPLSHMMKSFVRTGTLKVIDADGHTHVFAGAPGVVNGTGAVSEVLPVALHVRGCPPTPMQLLEGLLALMEA